MASRRVVATEFGEEIQKLLLEAGESPLASQVNELMIFDRCRCGDDFCSTFYTAPHPQGPWGPDHRTVALSPRAGILNIDLVGVKIVCVEVLYREEIKVKIHAAGP